MSEVRSGDGRRGIEKKKASRRLGSCSPTLRLEKRRIASDLFRCVFSHLLMLAREFSCGFRSLPGRPALSLRLLMSIGHGHASTGLNKQPASLRQSLTQRVLILRP